MGIIDWDETPSAGDCYDETSWANMVQYIKHSNACVFTIYDDDSSTSQKFKFSYSGNDNILEGDDTTGKKLILKATSADAFPYINLVGGGSLCLNSTLGKIEMVTTGRMLITTDVESIYLLKNSGDAWGYLMNNGSQFDIYGGLLTGRNLGLHANIVDVYPKMTMVGNAQIELHSKSGTGIYTYAENTQAFKLKYSSNVSYLYGGSASGDDVNLLPNTVDVFPAIRLYGGEYIIERLPSTNPHHYFQADSVYFGSIDLTTGGDFTISSYGGSAKNIFLNPDGVGLVKFGTYSALGAEVLAGFITIKDAAGNLRKVAIVA